MPEEKKEEKKEDTAEKTKESATSIFTDLIKWAVKSKSIWAILIVLVVGLVGSIFMIAFVFKSRKIAKMRHKANVAKEDLLQKAEDAKMAKNEEERKELEKEIKEKEGELEKLEEDIAAKDAALDMELDELDKAKSWDDL
jgi:uncharacterized protein HemX